MKFAPNFAALRKEDSDDPPNGLHLIFPSLLLPQAEYFCQGQGGSSQDLNEDWTQMRGSIIFLAREWCYLHKCFSERSNLLMLLKERQIGLQQSQDFGQADKKISGYKWCRVQRF